MPWSNQSGGGWSGGNNGGGGGPWGQRPQPPRGPGGPGGGGGGGGGTPPDLEEIIRKSQDRLKQVIPGGGGFSPMVAGLALIALIGLYIMNAIYTVQADQRGVELRFGKPKPDLSQPGIHMHWWPLESYQLVSLRENQTNLGTTNGSGNRGLMLSGDQNIVDVSFSVLYQVDDATDYIFNVRDPDEMVREVAESAMREVVGRRPAQDIFRDDRAGIADEVRQISQDILNGYGAGLRINAITIEDVAPPREVADAFDEVQRAEQDEDRFREEAIRYSNRMLGEARGEAAQIREDAAAYKNRVVQEATGEAQRFLSVYEQYKRAPEVTRRRLFLETMEDVLRNSDTVIIEQGQGGQGVVPYLPLPEINKQRQQSGASSSQGVNQ